MFRIDPNQNNSNPRCFLHNLFHFTVKPQDSTTKKVLTILGYTLFHVTTLGIPLLVHFLTAHNCCRGGDGINTLSSTEKTTQKTIDNAVTSVRGETGLTPSSGSEDEDLATGTRPPRPPTPPKKSGSPIDKPLKPKIEVKIIEHVTPPKSPPPVTPPPASPEKWESPTDETLKPKIEVKIIEHVTPPKSPPPVTPPPASPLGVPVVTVDPNSLEGMRISYPLGHAPHSAYQLLSDRITRNPGFTVSYPVTASEFFRAEGSLKNSLESPLDSEAEKKRKRLIRQQIQYLDSRYLVLEVSGDGNCFYRAFATSWLMGLVREHRSNPNCFREASQLVLNLQEYAAFSSKNQQLVTGVSQIFLEAQNFDPPTPKAIMNNIILNQKAMELTLIPFLTSLASFESGQHIFKIGAEADEESAKEILLTHVREDPSNLWQCFKKACTSDKLRSMFVNNLLEMAPESYNDRTPAKIRSMVRFFLSNPLLTTRHTEIQLFLTQYLPKNFLLIDPLNQTARTLISEACKDRPIVKKAWDEFYEKTHPTIPELSLQVYGFIKSSERDLKNMVSPEICRLLEDFTKNLELSILDVLNMTSENGSNFEPQIYQRVATEHRNYILGSKLIKSFFARPEIFNASIPVESVLEELCRLLNTTSPLSRKFGELADNAYQAMSGEEKTLFNLFLSSSPIQSIQSSQILSNSYLLYLFLKGKESQFRTLAISHPVRLFVNLADLEISRFLNTTPLEIFHRKVTTALSSLLTPNLPTNSSLLPTDTSLLPAQQNYVFIRNLITHLERQPQTMVNHPLFLSWLQDLGGTQALSPLEDEEKTKAALAKIEELFPGEYENFVANLRSILPPQVILGTHYMIYLFIIGSPERKRILKNLNELSPFTIPFTKLLHTTFSIKIAPDISISTMQQLMLYLKNFPVQARLFFLQFTQDPYCAGIINNFLKTLPLRTLHQIYSAAVTQAEGDHVEAISNGLLQPAICESLSNNNQLLNIVDLENLASSQGFLRNFSPEATAPIHLLRITNHYCCLIPKNT